MDNKEGDLELEREVASDTTSDPSQHMLSLLQCCGKALAHSSDLKGRVSLCKSYSKTQILTRWKPQRINFIFGGEMRKPVEN
jgi:hypothetical protein